MPKVGVAPIRRRALIDAVLGILSNEGWEALTVRRVSALSDVSVGAIPHFLGTKGEMVAAAIEYGYQRYQRRIMVAVAKAPDAFAKVTTWIDMTISPTANTDEEWGFWLALWGRIPFEPSLRKQLAPVYRAHSTTMADVVRGGIDDGSFCCDIDASEFADQLVAMIDGLMVRCRMDPGFTPKYARELISTFVEDRLGGKMPHEARPVRKCRPNL
jgi:TetR/AcrR family transcriptional regulator, transcriptional repressor of bet genes